ncbi:MAG: hypothetical protein GY771_15260 [bacterium]|nr:hypothetical protein [bacterium]
MRKFSLIAALIVVFAFGTVAQTYTPKKEDVKSQLYWVLGATKETLGWDNVYCGISVDKSVELFGAYKAYYDEGGSTYTFCGDSTATLNNLSTTVNQLITEGKGLDPGTTDAKNYRKDIQKMRDKLYPPSSPPKKVGEIEGDKMKEKWKERGDMMKKKWAERGN